MTKQFYFKQFSLAYGHNLGESGGNGNERVLHIRQSFFLASISLI